MRVVSRPLAPGELDHELVWLVVSVSAALLAAVWLWLQMPWPICFFHTLTGHPCPTCGATRAALAFFRGDFATAWNWNPLATISYGALAAFDLYSVVVLIARTPRLRLTRFSQPQSWLLRLGFAAILLANWVYLWRNPSI